MTTQFIGVAPSALLGTKQYYRLTVDVSGQALFERPEDRLNWIYDHIGDTQVLDPLSPNPVVSGSTVMVVDVWSAPNGVTVAEAVRRLEMVASNGAYSSIRSIQKLSSIGDVTNGADARAGVTDDTNKENAANTPLAHLLNILSGLGDYATLGVIALVAYAAIKVSAGLPWLDQLGGARRRR